MGYPIVQRLITQNRSGSQLIPQGVIIHSTATPGATDEAEFNYFNGAYRDASAHYFIDWDSITRTIPDNEVAWHAGTLANYRFLSIEMCEPAGYDPAKFEEVWNRTVWLVTDMCNRYPWGPGEVHSHDWVTKNLGGTDHTDPIAYFAKYGKTWNDFIIAIGGSPMANTYPGYSFSLTEPPMNNEHVAQIQQVVGAVPDGFFGPKTKESVISWQGAHGLVPDGVVGPLTWNAMFAAPVAQPSPQPPVEPAIIPSLAAEVLDYQKMVDELRSGVEALTVEKQKLSDALLVANGQIADEKALSNKLLDELIPYRALRQDLKKIIGVGV